MFYVLSVFITKTIQPEGRYYHEGDTITYDYTVENQHTETINDILASDDKLGMVSCPLTTLAAGESMTCTSLSYNATAADVSAGSITNVATVTGTLQSSGDTITHQSTATAYRYSACCRVPGVCSEVAGPTACSYGIYSGDGIACPPDPCRELLLLSIMHFNSSIIAI